MVYSIPALRNGCLVPRKMTTHDVLGFVGSLRDHLASHERPVSFLFGAGTSCAVNTAPVDVKTGKHTGFMPLIPAVAGMTSECQKVVDALGGPQKAAWTRLELECVDLHVPPNIESILGRVRSKLDAITGTDTLHGLSRAQWQEVDDAVRRRIAELAAPSSATIPPDLPHHAFARWVRNTTRRQPVEVFTTNYDVLFETAFDVLCVPHFDGFIGSQHTYFSADAVENDTLLPSVTWVRYWKLHGSVSWSLEPPALRERITRRLPTVTGEMVLPSHRKYDESRKQPYRALMDRLGRVLAREDSLLISCGFSFSDQHINAIVLDALERHPRTHLIVLSHDDITDSHPVSQWGTTLANVVHVGPNAATISGYFGPWDGGSPPDPHLLAATGGLVVPDPKDPSRVRMQAGDFNAFCRFLTFVGGPT